MPKDAASTKATGGGGYTFADKVAAGFLAQMLRGKFPLEPELGTISTLHFETRDLGNVLDDLLLILRQSQNETKCAVSVKSNRQLTKAGFNAEFVRDAWEQWQGGEGSDFDPAKDVLGLVAGIIDEPTLNEWQELQKQAASTTPDRLVARLMNDGQSSSTQRKIFESLRKSHGAERDAAETARLVSRLRVLRFTDNREGDDINLCAEIVRDGTLAEGAKLWSRLLHLAAENRGTGGYFVLPKLIRALRPEFDLQDHPDFRNDWAKMTSLASENVKAIRNVIGSGIQLERQAEKARLKEEVDGHDVVVVAGESGSGKSAATSQLISAAGAFSRIIWLRAEQLSKASQAELAQAFGLTHTIPDLIANSAASHGALVVDAFEKFEGEARRRAIELLKAVRDEGFATWKVIVTCQPQTVEPTIDALMEAGITGAETLNFENPKFHEIFDAVEALPAVRTLLVRAELQPILRNLTVLDWVLREDVAQRFSTSRPWIGETELIDCIWERWLGPWPMRLARDALLRTLGKREGERLSGAVHVDSIPLGELPLLGTLAQEGLIRAEGPSIQFAHDLIGDWARYRVLKSEGNDAYQTAKAMAPVPRWCRAIRLYAQSLAERGAGLADWKAVTAKLAGEDAKSKLAHDLFLDGLLFAPNSEYLLEQVWSDLTAVKGQILQRLLKRLPHVASFPDWRVTGFGDPKLAEQVKVWFRIPQPIYWAPVLTVLSRHAGDVAAHALILGAEVCALWLRTMPLGMPGRREAGLVALELAREAQGLIAEGMHFGDRDKVIYEAALWAGPEFPDEVTQLALELCARQPEPAHAVQRRAEERARERKRREEWAKQNPEKVRNRPAPPFMLASYREGLLRPTAPDGPLREVSDGFRAAVMQTHALNGLIAARPDVAREVLLAVCIDEPKPFDRYSEDRLMLDRLGLADWRISYPAAYWKGPFFRFLQAAPQQGLDGIVRLVNYATERWLEGGLRRNPTDDDRRKYSYEFEIDGQTKYWAGDANVYAWHRFQHMHGDTVECALMALEKWFYDAIEKNNSITASVQYIFDHGESAAFAGLLVSVGLRHPALFTRELQPLLGNFYVYECQSSLAANEQGECWSISLSGEPQEAIRLAAEWNRMPHRRRLLRDAATWLMLQDEGTAEFLAARKAEWAKLRHGNEKQRLRMEFFLARFDPENYRKTPQEDGILITMRWPEHLEKIAKESEKEGRLKSLALTLALRARRLLEGQEQLSPQDIPGFAALVRELGDWKSSGDDKLPEHYRVNSIAGGLAVLVIRHRPWLSENPDIEQWCMAALRELKPVMDEHFSPVAINEHTAEAFLGEAGAALLQESDETWVLRLAFEGVTGAHYSSTLYTLWCAYSLREPLGPKFGQLVNVMVLWSALRYAAGRELGPYRDDVSHLHKFRTTLFRRYAAGELAGPLIPLSRVELMGRRLAARIERRSMSSEERRQREAHQKWVRESRDEHKIDREMPDIDLEVLQKGFAFLSAMVREARPGEEALLRQYVQELFDLQLRTLPRPDPGDMRAEIQGTPYQSDVWVMGRIAEYIAHANSVETAREFYRPILELGPAGKYWVEDFLQSWIASGLKVSPDLKGFARIWQDMVAYSESLPAWQPGNNNCWSRAEQLAVELVGIGEIGSRVLGNPTYQGLITSMVATYERWGERWLKYASVAAWFANFLRTDSGGVLLPVGVKQLAAVIDTLPNRDWYHHDLGSLFADVLSLCWKHLQNDVEKDGELREAFLGVLTVLCARQIPEALHLRARVAEVLDIG